MKERTQIASKLILSHFFIIIVLIYFARHFNQASFLPLIITQITLSILYLAGYWEFVGLRFKNIYCSIIQIFILYILVKKLYIGSNYEMNFYWVLFLSIIAVYLVFEFVKIIIILNKKDKSSKNLEFPFREGSYLVTDGGNSKISRLMNYHYYSPIHKQRKTNNSMLYATDIVKIGDGMPIFLSMRNEDYPIYGAKVYSPMNGIVFKVINDIPDNNPFAGHYPYNTGNTIVIKKDDLYLLLGHLKQGTILVNEGDTVQAGDFIALAGNSGWSERPHIHIQLIKSDTENYWSGRGISILYKSKNLYKNRLIKLF